MSPRRARRLAPALLCLLGLLAPRIAPAQWAPTLGAGAGLGRSGMAQSTGGLFLAPSLELGGDALRAAASGSFVRFPNGAASAEWQGSGTWRTPAWRGFRAEGRLEARGLALPSDPALARAAAVARLRFGGDSAGAWVEAGTGRVLRDSGRRGLGMLGVGGRMRLGGGSVRFSLQAASIAGITGMFYDTVAIPGDTLGRMQVVPREGEVEPAKQYADAELGAGWGRGRVAVDVALGTRLGIRGVAREHWTRVAGSLRIDRRTTLLAMFGSTPGSPEFGTGRAPLGVVALRFSGGRARPPLPAPATPAALPGGDFEVRRAEGEGARVLSVRVPARESVEIRGDFSDWLPVPLARAGEDAGRWRSRCGRGSTGRTCGWTAGSGGRRRGWRRRRTSSGGRWG